MTLPPRFPVTPEQINRVVTRFYAAIRKDVTLGPIFARHVTDWPAHEDKIARFWRNAILLDHQYDGNAMQVHLHAGNVKSAHFPTWLALFDQILVKELPPDSARAWSALAHRIGRGLQFGLDTADPSRPPKLRAG